MFSDASNLVNAVDRVFLYIVAVSLVMLALVTAGMVTFAIRYRQSRNPRPENIPGSTGLEVVLVVVPTILVFSMFFYGWRAYLLMKSPPADALPVQVTARQWSWLFAYPNGRKADELVVPLGRAVRLDLRSADVIHGLSIPAFRVKQDAVPGSVTSAWFIAQRAGSYDLYCSMFCGDGHSRMLSRVVVLPPAEFEAWLGAPPAEGRSPAERGRRLAREKGCLGCHSLDGTASVGPTFQGLYGRQVQVRTADRLRELRADEEYLRRAILEPKADLVPGFPDVMPAFGRSLTDAEVGDLVQYLKTLPP